MKFNKSQIFLISFIIIMKLMTINVQAVENVEGFIERIGKINNYDTTKMINYCNLMLNDEQTKGNDDVKAKIYYSLVVFNRVNLNYNESLKHVNSAEYYLKKQKYFKELIDVYEIASNISSEKEEFKMALYYAYEAIELLEDLYVDEDKIVYKDDMVAINYLMATIIQKLNAPNQAKEYYDNAKKLQGNEKVEDIDIIGLRAIYNYYDKNFEEAEMGFKERYNNLSKIKYNNGFYIDNQILISLAYTQIQLEKFEEAKKNLNIVESNINNLDNKIELSKINQGYGDLFYAQKEYDIAKEFYCKAYENMKNDSRVRRKRYVVKRIINIYKMEKDDIEELKWRRIYDNIYLENSYMNDNDIIVEIVDKFHKENHKEIDSKQKHIYSLKIILMIFILTTVILVLILILVVERDKGKKRQRINNILEEKLNKDPLTQTYNRQYLNNLISKYENEEKKCIIAMLDIDNYKQINDKHGHLFGDYVLVELVKVINKILNQQGILIRYGGEEFSIIFEDIELNYVEILENIRCEIENIYWTNNEKITVTIGVSKYFGDNRLIECIQRADEMLYKGKKSGKNKIIYDENLYENRI